MKAALTYKMKEPEEEDSDYEDRKEHVFDLSEIDLRDIRNPLVEVLQKAIALYRGCRQESHLPARCLQCPCSPNGSIPVDSYSKSRVRCRHILPNLMVNYQHFPRRVAPS